jgi:hypothetical protein
MSNDTTSTVGGEQTQNLAKRAESSGLSGESLAALLDNAIPDLSGSSQAGTPEPVSDSGEIQSESDQTQGFNTFADVADGAGEDVSSEESSGNEPESEEQDSDEDDVDELPKGIKKRLSKLAAKKREAEERLRKAEQEIEELRLKAEQPRIPLKKDDNPFENLSREEELQKANERARQVRDWCEENPYGGTITKSDGTEVEIDEREARRMKVQAMRDLEVNIPAQFQKIQARKQFDPLAEQAYPWWKKKESAEYKTAQAILQNFPELAKFPDYKLVVGDFVFGMSARQARSAKNANQVNKAPYQPSRPTASPVSQPQNKQKALEAESRFNKTRSRDDLASLIEARYFG